MTIPLYSEYKKVATIEYLGFKGEKIVSKSHKVKGYDKVENYIVAGTKIIVKGLGSLEILKTNTVVYHHSKKIDIEISCTIV